MVYIPLFLKTTNSFLNLKPTVKNEQHWRRAP